MAMCLVSLLPTMVLADDGGDNSGTNPIAFTGDFRMMYEAQSWPGDNSFSMTTFQFRKPIVKNLQLQVKVPFNNLTIGGPEGFTASGMGDISMRLLTVPFVNKKYAFCLGLEGFFSTASQPVLGSNRVALGPQIFGVIFNPLGFKGSLFAPAVQQKFTIDTETDGPDIHQTLIDLYVVWLPSSKKYWFILDPQIVVDAEKDYTFGQVEIEIGQMMFGPTSSYIRPGFGVGEHRAMDWNIEVGFKVVWK
jgi:hypothetical protein